MIEPWITAPSYLLYRYFHHEDCSLASMCAAPGSWARALMGMPRFRSSSYSTARPRPRHYCLLQAAPLGLPYLATLGFKSARLMPRAVMGMARVCERFLSPWRRWASTWILIVWEHAKV